MKTLIIGLCSLLVVTANASTKISCSGAKMFGPKCSVNLEIETPELGNIQLTGAGLVECKEHGETFFSMELTRFNSMGLFPSGFVLVAKGELVEHRIPQELGLVSIENGRKRNESSLSFYDENRRKNYIVDLQCSIN